MREETLRTRGEIRKTGAYADHQIRPCGQGIGAAVARNAYTAQIVCAAASHSTFAGLCFTERDSEPLCKSAQIRSGIRIPDSASTDQQRPRFTGNKIRRCSNLIRVRAAGDDPVNALAEEIQGIVPGLRLDILRQRDGNRPGVGLISQHTHRVQQSRHQLFRPADPVPIFAHGLEGVIDRDRQIMGMFHLLQHRIGLTGGKRIAGKQQNRDLISRCSCRGRQHIGRAGSHRSCTGHDPPSAALLGKGGRRMNHALLISSLVNCQPTRCFLQRLPQTEYIAMTENRKYAVYEALRSAAKVHVLPVQKLHQRL
ncbi:hypothetical protein D3C75_707270 [compost metagenome]